MRRALRKRRVFDFVPSYLNCKKIQKFTLNKWSGDYRKTGNVDLNNHSQTSSCCWHYFCRTFSSSSHLRGVWRDHCFPQPFSWFLHETGLKVSRDTFHFPWTRKLSFFSLKGGSGWGQNTKNNGVLQGIFCIFTCPKEWHFSWKMNIRMSVQNLTILSPGSLFFNQQRTCFFFACFWTMRNGNCKKILI